MLKILSVLSIGLFAHSSFANEYLQPLYKLNKGEVSTISKVVISSAESKLSVENNDNDTDINLSSNSLQENLAYGFNKKLTILMNLDYVINEDLDDGNEKASSGLKAFSVGASYRLNEHIKLPFVLEVGTLFKPSFADGVVANVNDDGSVNSGGHELDFFAIVGISNLYSKTFFDFNFEQNRENATTGDVESVNESSIDFGMSLGAYFKPIKNLLVDVSLQFARVGEVKNDPETGSGDITSNAFFTYGFSTDVSYQVWKSLNVIGGFAYTASQEQEIEANSDYKVIDYSKIDLTLGVSYLF